MDALLTTYVINTIANVFAQDMSEEELALFAAIFTQFADTLATIAVQRTIEEESSKQDVST